MADRWVILRSLGKAHCLTQGKDRAVCGVDLYWALKNREEVFFDDGIAASEFRPLCKRCLATLNPNEGTDV